jgi:hypothetical protein
VWLQRRSQETVFEHGMAEACVDNIWFYKIVATARTALDGNSMGRF